MGFFNKKNKFNSDKVYSMEEALKILKKKEFEDYTSLEVGTGRYRIVTIEESRNLAEQVRRKNNGFFERIVGGGTYKGISVTPNYNNYQSAKRYRENANYR